MKLNFRNDGGRTLLSLDIIGKEDSEGWLRGKIEFEDNGFLAYFQLSLMLNDLYEFHNQLRIFKDNLNGGAILSTIEDNVNLVFSGDGLGHISISGTLRHNSDPELKLLFEISSDQTLLPSLLEECDQILRHYHPQ